MCRRLIYLVSFLLVLSVSGNASAELVGHWKFDGNLDDSAGSANGIFTGGTPGYGAGMVNQALVFDGADDYLELPSPTNPATYTITAWVKLARTDAANIIARTSSSGPTTHWSHQLRITSSGMFEHYTWDGSARIVTGTTAIEADTWYFVVSIATNDGDVRLYVNGQEEGAATTVGTLWGAGDRYHVGSNSGNAMGWLEGMVDDIRIYDHILSEVEILSAMAGQVWPYAWGPTPADGALHADTWLNLSWRPGGYAVSHDVYLGDNFDDVESGAESTFQGNQTDVFLVAGFPGFAFPDGLVPGTTYYWRIDEVNDTEPNSPWKGDIWSFSIPPKTAYFPNPADGAESVGVDDSLSWTAGFGAKLHYVYFGDNFDEVENAAGALPQGATEYSPGTLKMAKTYYWRVDEFDVGETYKGDIWSFTTEGAVAALNPANGAADVTQTPVLTWAPGLGASHEVYFGADAASMELKGSGNLGSESYDPGQLEWDTTYYWRIDEVNNANADSPWTGPLWSFTTANFLIIDNMESYNDIDEGQPGSNRIYLAWIDGFDSPATNGAVVGNLNPPFAEQTIVHTGNQSMPMAYDNAVGKSEATYVLTSNKDWTVNGVTTLTIWYRGASGNVAELLYVALNGGTPVTNDDPDAATRTSWTEWNIDLQAFSTNLANVNSITLGLSSVAGGSGMMYFDDIRLYPPAP
ncbi:MAG: LamG domain-containing protein [Planctomycetes bacterium]|nr:LamG domain-containing protein [Planctomycetota bacterium]